MIFEVYNLFFLTGFLIFCNFSGLLTFLVSFKFYNLGLKGFAAFEKQQQ
jgi:hypothetical protein